MFSFPSCRSRDAALIVISGWPDMRIESIWINVVELVLGAGTPQTDSSLVTDEHTKTINKKIFERQGQPPQLL